MKLKGILYAPPTTGKSVFANAIPNRCFITTDGNYRWLEDFGADPADEFAVSSWSEFKTLIKDMSKFDKYDAIVVDLLEDLYTWAEYEFLQKNRLVHISDAGGYGRGYDIVRGEVLIELSKLIGLDKNIIFLSHEKEESKKDARGIEYTKKSCSGKISGKLYDGLNGKLDFILRAGSEYVEVINEDNESVMELVRYISLMPNAKTELGSIRHVDTNKLPNTIALDWEELLETFERCKPTVTKKANSTLLSAVNVKKPAVATSAKKSTPKTTAKVAPATPTPTTPQVEETKVVEEVKVAEPIVEAKVEPKVEPVVEQVAEPVVETKSEDAVEDITKPAAPVKESAMDRLARIKAQANAMRAK